MDTPSTPLERAVAACNGQAAFARKLAEISGRSVAQQHVYNWLKRSGVLPAEYVIAAEAATGISRHELRPDIYPIDAPALSVAS